MDTGNGLQEIQKALGILGELAKMSGAEFTLRFPATQAAPQVREPIVEPIREKLGPPTGDDILDGIELGVEDTEFRTRGSVTPGDVAEYLKSIDHPESALKDPMRQVRKNCEDGLLVAEKVGKAWIIDSSSVVMWVYDIPDPRLKNE